ncbi:Uncharacterised protein [Mycobacteroides abscessus]|nr:Uncharacterised protein [Mycobacteroides abscessus]
MASNRWPASSKSADTAVPSGWRNTSPTFASGKTLE